MIAAARFGEVWRDGGLSGMEENKKSASPKKNCACREKWRIVCIKGGMSLPVVACHNRPSEAHLYGCAVSKLRFRLRLSLAWRPQYSISDGRFRPHGNSINSINSINS